MRNAIFAAMTLAVMAAASPAGAQLASISHQEAADALRAALERSAQAAVATLGRHDGFFADPRVKIPLPDALARAERTLRRFGMGRQADDLVLAMNRAAEAAVPQARQLFVDAARKMTLQDAKSILQGGDTAGTAYFRGATEEELRRRFLPVVQQATAQVGMAQRYNRYAGTAAAFGLLGEEQASLDDYVTARALDGLFFMVAEEEKKIRKDPVGTGVAIIRRVFGSL
jgi:hypothetical protein